MRLRLSITLVALVTIATPAVARDLRVMSFNVRLPLDSDGANRWEARRDLFIATVRRADPDISGRRNCTSDRATTSSAACRCITGSGAIGAGAMPTNIWASSIAAIA